MSKPLTISVSATDDFDGSINGVLMDDPMNFRLTWQLLEEFDDAYGHNYKELPTKFIKDIYDLVNIFYSEHLNESVLLTIFQEALEYNSYKDFKFRIKDKYEFDELSYLHPELIQQMGNINQRIKKGLYKFKDILVYPYDTRLSDVLKNLGVYDKWYKDLVASEIENTLDEGWTTFTNHFNQDELDYFESLSNTEKEVYAHAHAHTFVKNVMNTTLEYFDKVYGFDYLDTDLEVTYKHGEYHINVEDLL